MGRREIERLFEDYLGIERTIWLSRMDPLGRIGLIVRRQGDTDPVLERLYQDEVDTRPLAVKYGPRPDGLPG